ncbi:MAG TPA: hypothetical protein VLA04_02405 [Verrucomicrobiae bacterium]|nr:hypothetical protein [Verrucomicrobiae bacterium]
MESNLKKTVEYSEEVSPVFTLQVPKVMANCYFLAGGQLIYRDAKNRTGEMERQYLHYQQEVAPEEAEEMPKTWQKLLHATGIRLAGLSSSYTETPGRPFRQFVIYLADIQALAITPDTAPGMQAGVLDGEILQVLQQGGSYQQHQRCKPFHIAMGMYMVEEVKQILYREGVPRVLVSELPPALRRR